MKKLFILAALAVMFGFGNSVAAEKIPVDLELVLAVDVSASMLSHEKAFVRDGYVKALGSPQVVEAIQRGPLGRIAVALIETSAQEGVGVILPWTIIDSAASAQTAAARLAESPAFEKSPSGTAIGSTLLVSAQMLKQNSYEGTRLVIDMSGDGPNNTGVEVALARDKVVSQGITINGLPLMTDPNLNGVGTRFNELDQYYEECVIGGPGAFVIPVTESSHFEKALLRKLILEIASESNPPIILIRDTGPLMDCLIGEKELQAH